MKNQTLPYFYLNADAKYIQPYISSNEFNTCCELVKSEKNENIETFTYITYGGKLEVKVIREHFKNNKTVRQKTTVKNISDENIVIDTLSSLYVNSIGSDGNNRWFDDRFNLYRCDFVWQGEGQWRKLSLSDCGLYPTYNHDDHACMRILNQDSWSTCHFYPIVMLEDKELSEIWYFEQESHDMWSIEVGLEGYQKNSALCVFLSSAYEKCGGWYKELKPCECYESKTAVYGCVKGGFEEAVRELNGYKRIASKMSYDRYPTLMFNDYMNCLWGLPTKEKLIPLIDKAYECGCEGFCIDDGWYKGVDGKNGGLGTWIIDDSLFPHGGLKSIIDYINSKGMRAGIWLELESAAHDSYIAKNIENSCLMRHNRPVGGNRRLVNFRNEKVRKYLENVIDGLYSLGIRYIKNDYNQTVGIGADGAECMAENLMQNSLAFMEFIYNIQKKYPDLYIESCCSGAMRCDGETLKNFRVQSTSDQEYYENYPSIVQGMGALIPPEKCGIWVYPYPVPIHWRMDFKDNEEFASKFADGKVTVYNVVSGLLGCFYMSGRISNADEYNLLLMKEGIELYKRIRPMINESYPIYPTGLTKMADDGIITYGLCHKESRHIMLGVWKKNYPLDEAVIDLSKYANSISVEEIYPKKFEGISYTTENNKLCVKFPNGNIAAYFLIKY